MSTTPDTEFDLESLFLPAWAKQTTETNRYAQHPGDDRPDRRGDDRRGPRPPRRDSPRPAGRDQQRSPQRDGSRPPFQAKGKFQPRSDRDQRSDPRERREAPVPLPDVDISFRPEEKGVDSLARQIKITGRAYPLFQIAQMILQKPDRHTVTFEVVKKPDGTAAQPLFVCALDDSLWLSEDEAVNHVLDHHFATFYQTDRTPTDPPKGTYTFVAQCSMTGVILGPPNYHDYQNQLRKLHEERFSRMPFEVFKARVKIVRDEATVKQWIDSHSFKTEYVCLNVAEPLKLASRDDVAKHFRETHLPNIIKSVDSFVMAGIASRSLKQPLLLRLLRQAWEDQKRFPLQIATVLSQQFAARGLQFFKVNKTLTHVCVARPHYLDLETTPVSDGVKCIVNFLNAHPKCTRRQLLDALAPAVRPEKTDAAAAAAGAAAPSPGESSPEVTALSSDLHWLIHEGHVIEFADGILDTAKKPVVKPPKPAASPTPEKVQASTPEQTPPPDSVASSSEPVAPAGTEQAPPPEMKSEELAPVSVEMLPPKEKVKEEGQDQGVLVQPDTLV